MQYYSTDLDKLFDTIEELETAEKAFKEENEKKLAAKEERKAEAKVVEDAYKALHEAKIARAKSLKEAFNEYKQACSEAREKYLAIKDAQDQLVKQAAEKRDIALKEFTNKHPEGYHLTIKDADGSTTTISANTHKTFSSEYENLFKEFDNFWSSMFKGLL